MKYKELIFNDTKKYYAVHCRCGHVGINCYIEIVFAVIASNGREAAAIARKFARVKHNKKNAIIDCYEITYEEYNKIIEANKNDPYLKCKNIQEQRSIEGFESRINKEPEKGVSKKNKTERKSLIKYKMKREKEFIDALMSANA